MKTITVSLFVASCFTLLSCGSYEVQCVDSRLTPYFKAFAASDIDTLVVKRYTAGSNFTQKLDSFSVYLGIVGTYAVQHDTTIVRLDSYGSIVAGFDWQIYIPAKNKTVNITEIKSEQKTVRCNKGLFSMDKVGCACYNTIFSFKQDNVLVTPPGNFPEYIIYIQ